MEPTPSQHPDPPRSAVTLREVIVLCKESQIGAFGAQAAFFVLLSAMPFCVFLTALLRHLPWSEADLSRFLPLVPEAQLLFHGTEAPSAAILSVSAVTALWAASRGIVALTRGLNRMYGLTERRNYFVLRLWAFAETLVLEMALLCTLGGSAWSDLLSETLPLPERVSQGVQGVLGWLLLTGFFIFLYAILPDHTPTLSSQLPGAAGAALGWMGFTEAYTFYTRHVADFSRLYGTLSGAAMLMLWLWLCLCILFAGALFNRILRTG